MSEWSELLESSVARLRRRAKAHGAAGVIVSKGSVVARTAAGLVGRRGAPMTTNTSFDVASQTKLMTTVAVLRLVDQGKVSLDSPIESLLPRIRYRDPDLGARATVGHCLRHAAGFGHVTDPYSPAWPLRMAGLSVGRRRPAALAVSQARHLALHFAPGTKERYSNVGASLLAEILESVTGAEYPEALRRMVFEPQGMMDTSADPDVVPTLRASTLRHALVASFVTLRWKGVSGAVSTVADLGRLIAPYTELAGGGCARFGAVLRESLGGVNANGQPAAAPRHVAGWRREDFSDTTVLHEAGARPGVTVKSVVLPQHGVGVVLMVLSSARSETHGAALDLALAVGGSPFRSEPTGIDDHEALLGTWEAEGGALAFPLFVMDCGRRLTIAATASGAVCVTGRTFVETPLERFGGQPSFEFHGAHVTLHPVSSASGSRDRLVLGGPYAGASLRRTP